MKSFLYLTLMLPIVVIVWLTLFRKRNRHFNKLANMAEMEESQIVKKLRDGE